MPCTTGNTVPSPGEGGDEEREELALQSGQNRSTTLRERGERPRATSRADHGAHPGPAATSADEASTRASSGVGVSATTSPSTSRQRVDPAARAAASASAAPHRDDGGRRALRAGASGVPSATSLPRAMTTTRAHRLDLAEDVRRQEHRVGPAEFAHEVADFAGSGSGPFWRWARRE